MTMTIISYVVTGLIVALLVCGFAMYAWVVYDIIKARLQRGRWWDGS